MSGSIMKNYVNASRKFAVALQIQRILCMCMFVCRNAEIAVREFYIRKIASKSSFRSEIPLKLTHKRRQG